MRLFCQVEFLEKRWNLTKIGEFKKKRVSFNIGSTILEKVEIRLISHQMISRVFKNSTTEVYNENFVRFDIGSTIYWLICTV